MEFFTLEVYSRILDFLTTSQMACLALTSRRLYGSTLSSTVYLRRVDAIVNKLEKQVLYFYKKYNGVTVRANSRLVDMIPLRGYDSVRRRYLCIRDYLNCFSKDRNPMMCVFKRDEQAPLLFPPINF